MNAKKQPPEGGKGKTVPFWKDEENRRKAANVALGGGGGFIGGMIAADDRMPPLLSFGLGIGLMALGEFTETRLAPLAFAGGAAMLGGLRLSDAAKAHSGKKAIPLENGKRTLKSETSATVENVKAYTGAFGRKLMLDKLLAKTKTAAASPETPKIESDADLQRTGLLLGDPSFSVLDAVEAGLYRDTMARNDPYDQVPSDSRTMEYRPSDEGAVSGIEFDQM